MKTILALIFLSFQSWAAFDNTSHRYLMAPDFHNKVLSLFPNGYRVRVYNQTASGDVSKSFTTYCLTSNFQEKVFDVFGASSPITGEPQSPNPDINTIRSMTECLKEVIKHELDLFNYGMNLSVQQEGDISSESELARDSRARLFPQYNDQSATEFNNIVNAQLGSYLPDRVLPHTIHLVNYMLGPDEVIKDYGQAESAEQIAKIFMEEAKKKGFTNLKEYTQWVLVNLMVRDEFLSY